MLRLTTLFTFLTLSHYGSAQDWSPVPLGARLTYVIDGDSEVVVMEVDSVFSDSIETRNFIWRAYLNRLGEGCDSALLFKRVSWNNSYFNDANSLPFYEFSLDSNLRIQANVAGFEKFNIPLFLGIGDSNIFNDNYLISYDSLGKTEVFGEPDSVKHFSLIPSSGTESKGRIILSKRHGILSMPDFKELYSAYDSTQSIGLVELIGFEQNETRIGNPVPEKSYFFTPSIGDRYLYKIEKSGFFYSPDYMQDGCIGFIEVEVESVNQNDPTQFSASVKYYNDKLISVDKSPCSIYLTISLDWVDFSLKTMGIHQILFEPGYGDILYPRLHIEDGDFKINLSGYHGTCESEGFDGVYHNATTIKGFGLINNRSDAYFGSKDSQILIAAITSHGNYGIWPENLGTSNPLQTSVTIWPNPASEYLEISSRSNVEQVTIIDLYGNIALRSNQARLNLEGLANGVYLVEIVSGDQRHLEKVIVYR